MTEMPTEQAASSLQELMERKEALTDELHLLVVGLNSRSMQLIEQERGLLAVYGTAFRNLFRGRWQLDAHLVDTPDAQKVAELRQELASIQAAIASLQNGSDGILGRLRSLLSAGDSASKTPQSVA